MEAIELKRATLMLMLMLLTIFGTASAKVPHYLNVRVLILSGMHGGTAWYLDKSSVLVEIDDPPAYVITYQLFPARYDLETGEIIRVYEALQEKYLYNVKEHEMRKFNGTEWDYIPPIGSLAETGNEFSGEMAFYIAFGKKFYGGRQWIDRSTGEMRNPNFGEEIYERVDDSY